MSNEEANPIGRPRKYATEIERVAARKAQNRKYQEKVKRERFKRYHTDKTYREALLADQRRSYRMRKGSTSKRFGKNHDQVADFAEYRMVKVGGKFVRRLTLTPRQMASLFEITPKAFSGWLETGKFPEPKIKSYLGEYCYTSKQATAMAKAMSETMNGKAVFRSVDTEAIKKVHLAFRQHQP
jgi:hypothetical protein